MIKSLDGDNCLNLTWFCCIYRKKLSKFKFPRLLTNYQVIAGTQEENLVYYKFHNIIRINAVLDSG